jgi:hypothetical protein
LIADAFAQVERWGILCGLIELINKNGKFLLRSYPKDEYKEDFKNRGGAWACQQGWHPDYEEIECCDICSKCGRIRLDLVSTYTGPLMPVRDEHCDECHTEEIMAS